MPGKNEPFQPHEYNDDGKNGDDDAIEALTALIGDGDGAVYLALRDHAPGSHLEQPGYEQGNRKAHGQRDQ